MSTVIRASCHECGDVKIGTSAMNLISVEYSHSTEYSYNFVCPEGRHFVSKEIDRRIEPIVTVLVSCGVKLIPIKMPEDHPFAESKESLDLTENHLLDFIIDLNIATDELGDFSRAGVEPPEYHSDPGSITE